MADTYPRGDVVVTGGFGVWASEDGIDVVNYAEIAERFGVSTRAAERLASEGVFVSKAYQGDRKKWLTCANVCGHTCST